MKNYLYVCSFFSGVLFLALSPIASAHEVHNYRIGGKLYEFVVGSLNEPITVDDKTGVDFRVRELSGHGASADHHATEGAVEGLDQTLKVEVSAGDKKKTSDLSPVFGQSGAYKTTFYPTVQTTLTYRFFGTLNNTPIDLSFSCNPAGHPQAEEDTNEVVMSEGVVRTLKRGAFSCPVAKADLGFPEASASLYDLGQKTSGLDARVSELSSTLRNTSLLALGLAILGLIVGIGAWMKNKSIA